MKKIHVFLLPLYLMGNLLVAQPTIEWQKTYGGSSYDEPFSISQTSDGGYIVAGSSASSDGDIFGHRGGDDYWVLKLSSTGSIQWKKVLGGTGNEIAFSIQQTSDGGYFVAGYSESNNYDVSGNHGGYFDGWVVKLSSTGETQWQKALGGSGWDDVWSAQQTTDNGYILTGRSSSIDGDATENHGQLDIWVVKLTETGEIQWQKSLGGSKDEVSYSVKQTSDGGYIVAGETASTDGDVTGLHGNVDYWVVKLSADGALEWQKALGGNNADIASDILQTNDGGYVVVGYASSNSGDVTGQHGVLDYWIVKLNSAGELLWQKALGGTNPEWGRSIVHSGDGGYVIAGTAHSSDGDVVGNDGGSEYWVVKVSDTGELLWQKTYGGTMAENCYVINNTSDGGFILAGYSWSNNGDVLGSLNRGKDDFWIVKLSPESVAVEEPTDRTSSLEIYPNPATNQVTVTCTEQIPHAINIYSSVGEKVRAVVTPELSNIIDISGLPNGVYCVKLKFDEKTVTKKFSKVY